MTETSAHTHTINQTDVNVKNTDQMTFKRFLVSELFPWKTCFLIAGSARSGSQYMQA